MILQPKKDLAASEDALAKLVGTATKERKAAQPRTSATVPPVLPGPGGSTTIGAGTTSVLLYVHAVHSVRLNHGTLSEDTRIHSSFYNTRTH